MMVFLAVLLIFSSKTSKFRHSVTKKHQLLGVGLRPPDPLPGLRPWTPLGDFRPPDPLSLAPNPSNLATPLFVYFVQHS